MSGSAKIASASFPAQVAAPLSHTGARRDVYSNAAEARLTPVAESSAEFLVSTFASPFDGRVLESQK